MCKSDNREACASANDHVGKIQGALGTCDGSTRQASQANANDNTNVCRHKESKSCVDCTKHQHCGWCLSSNTCVDDKRESCKGTDDHVGRLQGATGRCDAADARGAREIQIEPESVCNYKETRSCGVCISKTGCAWCLNSGKCQNDNRESCDGAADHVSSSRIGTGTCDSSTNGRSSRTTIRVKADNAQQTICNLDPKAQENCEACLSTKDKDNTMIKQGDSERELTCAWCVSESKCVNDVQGLCKSMDDHIGQVGNKKECPSRVDKLADRKSVV